MSQPPRPFYSNGAPLFDYSHLPSQNATPLPNRPVSFVANTRREHLVFYRDAPSRSLPNPRTLISQPPRSPFGPGYSNNSFSYSNASNPWSEHHHFYHTDFTIPPDLSPFLQPAFLRHPPIELVILRPFIPPAQSAQNNHHSPISVSHQIYLNRSLATISAVHPSSLRPDRNTLDPPPLSDEELLDWEFFITEVTMMERQECSVCLEILEPLEVAIELPCNHCYHRDCIGAWMERRRNCPYCRHPVETAHLTSDEEDEDDYYSESSSFVTDSDWEMDEALLDEVMESDQLDWNWS